MSARMPDGWEDATVIPFAKSADAFKTGEFFGLMLAVEALEKLPKPQRETPGMGLAIATINVLAMTARSNQGIVAMRTAAKHGIDINTHQVANFPDGTAARPMDLAEQGL